MEGGGRGGKGREAFCARSRNLRTSFCVLFHGQFMEAIFAKNFNRYRKNSIVSANLLIASDKTRSLVLKCQLSFITSD